MLPEADNPPSIFAKLRVYALIARHVIGSLFVPKFPVGFWPNIALWAAVPETSVDEHGDLLFGKSKVGLSKQRKMPSPAADLAPLQKAPQGLPRRLVASWPDAGHDFGALGQAKNVGHGSEHLVKKT